MLKLVPFNTEWVRHDTLDLHAIYRRPKRDQFTGDLLRDPDTGFLQWNITTPLPVAHHTRWLAKGFEYLTLADTQDVLDAAKPTQGISQPLHNPQQYLDQHPRHRGPWVSQMWQEDFAAARAERLAKLTERIAKHGPEIAEEFEREQDPGYVLPESMKRSVASERSQPTEDAQSEAPAPRRRGRPRKTEAAVV